MNDNTPPLWFTIPMLLLAFIMLAIWSIFGWLPQQLTRERAPGHE